ncbi:hypothetical protein LBMAG53_22850 [Planctomycetota bacterium]|nr:hypothetical protein LBMAG53_22850 [Planctomycetota bacterium]
MPSRIFKRLAILSEDSLDRYRNKTAVGLLRFRPQDVVCVIDGRNAGQDVGDLTGVGHGIPIVGEISQALALGIEWVVIGVATPGGILPQGLRPQLYEAIRNRVGVVSGLHDTLHDPNLIALAARYAVELVNLRRTDDEDNRHISTGRARKTKAWRVLTVGTDANIGKTTTSLALYEYLKLRKIRSRFAATGQDGILVTGQGVCIDRCISDFAGGAAERLVIEQAKGAEVLVIEGQNSIMSPCYSGTALSLLHGSCPDAMILCHAPSRTTLRHTDVAMPTLTHFIELYQAMLWPLHPGRVVGIALNTLDMDQKEAEAALAEAARSTGLPCADIVREGDAGAARLAAAALAPAVAANRLRAEVLTAAAGQAKHAHRTARTAS